MTQSRMDNGVSREQQSLASILRRRAFRDGFKDGKQGKPMRQHTEKRRRYLYALGRMFANATPRNVRVYEQRNVSNEALQLATQAKANGTLKV